ncbi:hypothetical protein N7520_009764 [Penicillium odoratum]|uniref:uncharacterized protein n=1 Tax=Penicillium odoratum TaxID=1167516 RepID=UPI002546C3FB|nr:uncharacterized protein N7520_009764 [Penicillium odoratum]KAJ5752847.1 hypothetical protein N7520_009764 [Penicillium odoratum]
MVTTAPASASASASQIQNILLTPIPHLPWWANILSLSVVTIAVAIKIALSRSQAPVPVSMWSALSDMEKAQTQTQNQNQIQNLDSPPPISALDILKPLSLGGTFPSSGAVAARAREQMQMQTQMQEQNSCGTPELGAKTITVQKRNEAVEVVCEKDDDGARTFRRLVVEYN